METLVDGLRLAHILSGSLALLAFWLPFLTQKGGSAHRLWGRWYVRLMWVVAGSAAALSVKNVLIEKYEMAAFLGFIALITSNAIWYGVAVLRSKNSSTGYYHKGRLVFSSIIVGGAFALVAYGIALGGSGIAVLMFVFGGLGLTDLPVLLKLLRTTDLKPDWKREHIIGMCASGIAAYTAFFVFGANQFFSSVLPGYFQILPWIAPGLVGTFGIRYAVKRFVPG